MADLKTSDITNQNSEDSGLTSDNKNIFPKEIAVGKFFSFPNGLSFTVKSIRINGQVVKKDISRVLRPKDRVEIVAEKDNFYEIFNKAGLVFEGGEYFPPQNKEDFKGNIISFTLPKEESEITVPEGPVWISLGGQNGNLPIQTKFTFLQTTNNNDDQAKKSQNAAEEAARQRDSITAGLGTSRAGIRLKADEALATGNEEDLKKYVKVMASSGDTEGLKILLGKTSDQTFKVLLEQSIKISQNVSVSRTGQKVGNRVTLNQKVSGQTSTASATAGLDFSEDIAEEGAGAEISTETNVSGEGNVTGALESSKVKTQGQVEVESSSEQILNVDASRRSNINISANSQSSGNVGVEVDENLKTQAGISTQEQVVEAGAASPVSADVQTESKQKIGVTSGKTSADINASQTGNATANLNQNASSNSQVSGNINVDIENQNYLKTQKQVKDTKENEDSKDIKQNRDIKADAEVNQGGQIKDIKENEDSREVEDSKDGRDNKELSGNKPDEDPNTQNQNTNQESKAKLQTTQAVGAKALKDSLDRNDRAVEFRLGLNRSSTLGQKLKDNKPDNQAGILGKNNNQKTKQASGGSADSNLIGQKNLLDQGGSLNRNQDKDFEKESNEKSTAGNLPVSSETENEQKPSDLGSKAQPGNEQQVGDNAKEKDQTEPEEDLEDPEQQNVQAIPQQVKPKPLGIEKLEIEKAASLISHALNVLLIDAALWVWTASLISLGLLLVPAAIAADLLPVIKKYLIAKFAKMLPLPASVDKNLEMVVKEIKFSGAVKLNILLLNLAAIIWLCAACVGVMYIGCNDPVGKEADYRLSYMGLAGYVDICKSLESAAGAFGVNPPTGLLITPQGLLSTASWTEAIKQTAAAYAPVDSCILRVVVEKESGGQSDVIGCDCAYNGNPAACLNQPKKYYSGYRFNWDQCSYGIGITQWTIYQKRYATSATDFRRWRDANTPSRTPFGSAFYTVDDFLNPQTSLNLTAEKFQRDLRSNGNDVRAAFGAYVGQSSSQSRFVEERMRLYEMCKANGG